MHASNFVRFAQALGLHRLQGPSGAVPEAAVHRRPGLRGAGQGAGGRARSARGPGRVRVPSRPRGARRRLAAGAARRHPSRRPGKGGRPSGEGRGRLPARAAPLGAGRGAAALRPDHARQAVHPARPERRARHPHGADDAAGRRPVGGFVPVLRHRGRERGRGGGRARRRRSSPSRTAPCRPSPRARRSSSRCRSTRTPFRARWPRRCASPRRSPSRWRRGCRTTPRIRGFPP